MGLAFNPSRSYQPASVLIPCTAFLSPRNSHTPPQATHCVAIPPGSPYLWAVQRRASGCCDDRRTGCVISLHGHHGDRSHHRHTGLDGCFRRGVCRRTCPHRNGLDRPSVLIEYGGYDFAFCTRHPGHRNGRSDPFCRPCLVDALVLGPPVVRRESCALQETWNSLDAPRVKLANNTCLVLTRKAPC